MSSRCKVTANEFGLEKARPVPVDVCNIWVFERQGEKAKKGFESIPTNASDTIHVALHFTAPGVETRLNRSQICVFLVCCRLQRGVNINRELK